MLVLSETVLVFVIESRLQRQGNEYEHRDAEYEHDEIGERPSPPNLLRSSGARPLTAFDHGIPVWG